MSVVAIDTEFDWNPDVGRISVISLALIREWTPLDKQEKHLYLATDAPLKTSPFVTEHVLPVVSKLNPIVAPVKMWRKHILDVLGDDVPEFWGDCSAFDYVVLSSVMGSFDEWPQGWPFHVNDLAQARIPVKDSAIPHNALADAHAIFATLQENGIAL